MAKRKRKPKLGFKTFLPAKPLLRRYENTTSFRDMAKQLGVSESTVVAWSKGGQIHWRRADSIAVRLGNHPSELWGDDWTVLEIPRLEETDGTTV